VTMAPRRVCIADDHTLFRSGLKLLVESRAELVVVDEFGDGRAVLNAVKETRWDVLVLDLSLPVVGGAEVLRRISESVPSMPIVVLSMYSEEHHRARSLREGALAYLSKTADADETYSVIARAARGELIAQAPFGEKQERFELPHERLSPREFQVFLMIARGLPQGDIAAELNVSPSTVSTHIARTKEKLGVDSIADMVRYAFELRLLPGD
jgi:DNA-binding NarL/FixJ family response regulator